MFCRVGTDALFVDENLSSFDRSRYVCFSKGGNTLSTATDALRVARIRQLRGEQCTMLIEGGGYGCDIEGARTLSV